MGDGGGVGVGDGDGELVVNLDASCVYLARDEWIRGERSLILIQ